MSVRLRYRHNKMISSKYKVLAKRLHFIVICNFSVQCNSQKQWDEHCASEKHMFNVNSDKEHQWNFRPPPWGVASSNYQICAE